MIAMVRSDSASATPPVRHLATFGTVVPSGEEQRAGDASRASFNCSPAAVSAFYLLLTAEPAAGLQCAVRGFVSALEERMT